MSTLSSAKEWLKTDGTRAFLYALLIIFNVLFWILLGVFRWEISLRMREVEYFETQLFPIGIHIIPVYVILVAGILLSAATIGIIVRDRVNLAERKKLQILLAQILESLEVGIIVIDRKGMLMLVNESARKILPFNMPVRPARRFLDTLQDYPRVKVVVESALLEGTFTKETEHTIGSSEDALTVRISTLPLKNRQKKENGTLVLIRDVSDEVALQRQMRDAERLSTMGTLAAALAHEIRNPLEALNLNLELLDRIIQHMHVPPPEGEKIDKYIRVFDSEVSRLAGVVENFLSFARPGDSTSSSIRLDTLLQQVMDLMENQAASRNVRIGLVIGAEPIMVQGFEDRLKQLFLNLIINGIEAMPDGGNFPSMPDRLPPGLL